MPITQATQNVIAPNICTTDTVQTVTGAKTFTGNVTTSNLVNGTSLCYRNKIINGNFDIWQRGTSLASGTGNRFLADRFFTSSVGSTNTASLQSFSNGQTDVPNNPSYFYRTVVSSVAGNSNYSLLGQHVESVKILAGRTATLSFYAKADSAKPISVEFLQFFGTGGTPSSVVIGIGVQKLNLTTSWQKFTVTANIPSISGKTIGTNNDDYISVRFWFDAGSNYNSQTNSLGQQSGTFDIAQVQLEEGSVATPFELRPIGTELALCQRYYEVGTSFLMRSSPNGNAFNGAVTPLKLVTKRSTPTMSHTIQASNGSFSYFFITANVNYAEFAFSVVYPIDSYARFDWTANAEL